ncbi:MULTISPECIES: UbiA-like polyprenyltransferase [Olivibacter]|jgi:4-hydroxybenzoate polyprenyltransferase|uniref:4-hydroxybenzoate polyprenyltransferase n=2 Tax=Sphingobacteriaceae TaxID=84566 RepID=F4C6E9_SPHS2|nr:MULTISPECIES: UbiA-like polyprenyltransferase [Olivibacter]MDX3915094.1 UbiA-like polyprenyltransferase [Pseudosphingobacterium sp.]QEL03697.1 4-hydroxybenzoate octaprenyltransferase [Olivibacter sp. LS-1]
MKKYLSLVLFAHSIFAMPFAFIGFFLAIHTTNYTFNWLLLLLMLICMVSARNAAMAFNRYLDRDIDALNPRTAMRDIPAGRISAKSALIFTTINCIIFVIATYFINPVCFYLSPVALFVVLFYSYTKRITPLCHLVLGLGLGLAPLGAYLVVTGSFNIVPVLYAFSVLFWVSGFDIIYALQDEEFDRSHHLNSIPAYFGKKGALRISEVLHILSACCVIIPMFYLHLSWFYIIGVLFYCSLLVYQHLIVSPTDLRRVNRAFMTTNGIASVIFAMFFLLDIYFFG